MFALLGRLKYRIGAQIEITVVGDTETVTNIRNIILLCLKKNITVTDSITYDFSDKKNDDNDKKNEQYIPIKIIDSTLESFLTKQIQFSDKFTENREKIKTENSKKNKNKNNNNNKNKDNKNLENEKSEREISVDEFPYKFDFIEYNGGISYDSQYKENLKKLTEVRIFFV